MIFRHNGKEYREIAKKSIKQNKSFVPYLGITLTDLTFEDNKPNEISDLINFFKRECTARHLKFIQSAQNSYAQEKVFDEVEDLHKYILFHLPNFSENSTDIALDKVLSGVSLSLNEIRLRELGSFFLIFFFFFFKLEKEKEKTNFWITFVRDIC